MRPIVLDEKTKESLYAKFLKDFTEKLDNYAFNKELSITVSTKLGQKCKDKVKIVYTPKAWLRMLTLVNSFSTEVSWFGLVEKKSNSLYRVYDVLVPKQQVNGGKVDTTDEDMLEFYENLTDEQAEHLHFQAHSHVNFDTIPSGTDTENQMNIISGIPNRDGFYIFQIWNKKKSINTFIYDLTNNVFYDKDDVELAIEDEDYETVENFVTEAKKLVDEIKYTYNSANPWPLPKSTGAKPKDGYAYASNVSYYDDFIDDISNYYYGNGYYGANEFLHGGKYESGEKL